MNNTGYKKSTDVFTILTPSCRMSLSSKKPQWH